MSELSVGYESVYEQSEDDSDEESRVLSGLTSVIKRVWLHKSKVIMFLSYFFLSVYFMLHLLSLMLIAPVASITVILSEVSDHYQNCLYQPSVGSL